MTDYEKLLSVFAMFDRDLNRDPTSSGEKRITLSNCVTFEFSPDDKLKAYRVASMKEPLFRAVKQAEEAENWKPANS